MKQAIIEINENCEDCPQGGSNDSCPFGYKEDICHAAEIEFDPTALSHSETAESFRKTLGLSNYSLSVISKDYYKIAKAAGRGKK